MEIDIFHVPVCLCAGGLHRGPGGRTHLEFRTSMRRNDFVGFTHVDFKQKHHDPAGVSLFQRNHIFLYPASCELLICCVVLVAFGIRIHHIASARSMRCQMTSPRGGNLGVVTRSLVLRDYMHL